MATFYRVVQTNPPTEADFLSLKALGRPLRRDTPYHRRLFEGVSVTDTIDAARELVRRYPALGRFIAELSIEEDGPIRFEQTTVEQSHYTLWGSPRAMLDTVVSVVPA